MTRDPERIADIVSATSRIADIVDEGRTAFEASHVLQAALLYNIQVIGEAASGLSDEGKDKYSSVPWREIIAMRNRIVHEYFVIDLELVWVTATRDIPSLREAIER